MNGMETTGTCKSLERHPFVARLLQHVKLNAGDLKSFDAIIDGELSIRRRRDLIVDGCEYRKLCFVKDGYAMRYKLLRNGKRQILNVVLPGDIVGIPGNFFERAAYSVTAITDVTMNVCALDAYVQLCYRLPQFGLALAGLQSRRRRLTRNTSSTSAAVHRLSGCPIFSWSCTPACTLSGAPERRVSPCPFRRKSWPTCWA